MLDLKSTEVRSIRLEVNKGSILGDVKREALLLCITEMVPVEFVWNSERYYTYPEELLEVVSSIGTVDVEAEKSEPFNDPEQGVKPTVKEPKSGIVEKIVIRGFVKG